MASKDLPTFQFHEWWIKWYMKVLVTEEGVFAEDQVPDDYGGPQLEVEVVMLAIVATKEGYVQAVKYADFKEVMDKDRKKGIGLDWQPFAGIMPDVVQDEPTGDTKFYGTVYNRENEVFAEVRDKLINIMSAIIANQS